MQAGCCSKGVTFAGAAEPEPEPGPCEKFLRPLPVDQTDPLSAVDGARLHLLLTAAAGPGRLTAGRRLLVYRHAGAGPVRLQPRRRRRVAESSSCRPETGNALCNCAR